MILELVRPLDLEFYHKNYSYPKWIDGESLRVLVLENVDVNGEDFHIISHFKALRELSVICETKLENIILVGEPWLGWLSRLTNNVEVTGSNLTDIFSVCELFNIFLEKKKKILDGLILFSIRI